MPGTWSSHPSGSPELDLQHRKLLAWIRDLRTAIELKTREDFAAILDGFTGVVAHHMAAEERLMRTLLYPQAEVHAAEHRELFLHIQRLATGPASGADTLRFLDLLGSHHETGADAAYSAWVRSRRR